TQESGATPAGELAALDLGLGLTPLDWIVLVLVIAFAIRGLIEGVISQVFAALGLAMGVCAAGWLFVWLGAEWRGAEPAIPFGVLRFLVVVPAGLGIST